MPLHLLDSVRFQNLVHLLDPQYGLPSRKHLSKNLLIKKYDKLKAEIKSQLSSVKAINLTIDLWSNRQMRSFIGITGHYFSAEWLDVIESMVDTLLKTLSFGLMKSFQIFT